MGMWGCGDVGRLEAGWGRRDGGAAADGRKSRQ